MTNIARTIALFGLGALQALSAGCAEPVAPDAGGLSLWFAALTSAGCEKTSNGTGSVPKTLTTLAAVLTKANGDESIVRVSRSEVEGKGFWLVKGIPIGEGYDVEVHGCDAAGKVVYSGRSNGIAIADQQETATRVFLTPTGKLGCTGGTGGSAILQAARSLASSTALLDGNAVVAGGLKEWSSTKSLGVGSNFVDIYDYRLGTFRKGPELLVPRVSAHVHVLPPPADDATVRKVLVAGGVTTIKLFSKVPLPTPLLAPEKLDKESVPLIPAELLDLSTDSGKSTESPAAIGVGARPFSSSIHLGSAILFAGGVDDTGAALAEATSLGNLGDIAQGGKGLARPITLVAKRARPGLVKFPDGTVVVWGGHVSKKVEEMGEMVGPAASAGAPLTITGDAALLGSPQLATVGPVTVPLSVSDDTIAFLVAGGMPIATPTNASEALSYVVVVTRSTATATLKAASMSAGILHAGLAAVGVRLPSGHVLIAGGLVAPSAVPGVCSSGAECILDSFVLLEPPSDLAGPSVTLQVAASGSLGQPHFGMVAVPLPVGALLVGGQSSVSVGDNAEVLDDAGQVLVAAPSDERQKKICGK